MSEVNTVAAVAAGNPPQSTDGHSAQTDFDAIESEVNSEIDGANGIEASEEAGSEQAIDAAAQKGQITKAEAKELKRVLKLKIDGQEEDFEMPQDDEELKKHFQKSKAFDKRLKEFSGYKSQVDQLIAQLQSDPESVLEKMGLNVDEFAEKRLAKAVENMKKSPEQLEREKMSKELEDLRKEKKQAEEEKQKAELERMKNQHAQEIETSISDALEGAKSILPKKNPQVYQRIAQTMLLAMKNGYPEVTAKDVIPVVEKQWKAELNDLFNVLPEETLETLVGKANLDRYRKKRVSAAKPKVETKTATQIVKDTGAKPVTSTPKAEPKKFSKVFDWRS
jgi:hypothetical protein